LPAPPAAIATEQRAEYLAKVWARLVAGHDREVACERELEEAAASPSATRRTSSAPSPRSSSSRRGAAGRIAAAMDGSGHSIALIADLLAALKAAGHYDAPDRLARRAGQHFTPTLASGVNVR
jgi:hypothetical protein